MSARTSWSLLTPHEKTFFVIRIAARFALNGLDILAVGLMGVLGAITATGITGQTLTLFGYQLPSPSASNAIGLVVAIASLIVLKGGLSILFSRWTAVFLSRIEIKNSAKLARYLFSGSLDRLRRFSRAEIQFLVERSVNATFSGVLGAMTTLVIEGTLFISIFIIFVAVDWRAALAIVLYLGLVVFALQMATAKRYLQSGKDLQEGAVGAGASVLEMTDIFREMLVLGKQDFYLSRFVEAKKLSARTNVTLQILKNIPRYVTESSVIIGALIFVVWQLSRGTLTDALLALGIFLAGSMRIVGSILPLQGVWNELRVMQKWVQLAQGILVQLRDTREVFDSGIYSASKVKALEHADAYRQSDPEVVLEKVTFTHQGRKSPTISELSMKVKSGSTVAIVGPSGAGKTTLVDLMLGLYEPQQGKALIGGLSPSEVRDQYPGVVAYVPQKPGLVRGSIAENVALGFELSDIDEDRVWVSLRKAQLSDHVEHLPEGIHSSLGSHSDSLSGGQIQRLGLARALYSNPRLIVLDEATSALDASTEASITQAIASLGSDTTVIVIAHRLSTIQNVDQVHVLDNGAIVASGTFSEVRKKVPMIEEYVKLMSFDDE